MIKELIFLIVLTIVVGGLYYFVTQDVIMLWVCGAILAIQGAAAYWAYRLHGPP